MANGTGLAVAHADASKTKPSPRPLQIIRLGTAEENFSFHLEQANLDSIMAQVPSDMKVAVVSVVGAFRTGKSFLLTFLLRYLRYGSELDDSEDWMTAAGDLREGNINEKVLAGDDGRNALESSFQWRAGKERTTTGIWMWSEAFVRRVANGEEVAVLLMDTQGMFDNETSMNLTACIFGLSTLLSSYQIYNVQNRIQEDNLQHLALFSEYGRIALAGEAGKLVRQGKKQGDEGTDKGHEEKSEGGVEAEELMLPDEDEIPFQRVEFLVRDWMDFDEDLPFHQLKEEMDSYLQDVIEKGSVKDLRQTREQILGCFQKVRCFVLPHPGLEVPKKAYSGEVALINPFFRRLLNHYAREVFGPELEAKRIHKRDLTAPELRQYVSSYVEMFKSGTRFPEAQTMLEATASANNQNATQLALSKYKGEMDAYCGPRVYEYRKVDDFMAHHRACKDAALQLFDSTATIGRKVQVREFRVRVLDEIEDLFSRYEEANANRNPFRNFEYYALPLLVALAAFVMRWIADLESTCSLERRYLCTNVSNAMGHVYVFLITFILILSFNRVKLFVDYVRQVVPVLLGMDRMHLKTA
ncbi:hypothetical protein NSK_002879 [Nannochloropsis salina CCMP1776]|uniref:GB1/RHD3-type G domain-containing protein n=1 Tax=Nannochloropsis salina CCMP1776 TaxID=1027361 RepID=A0A4D9DBZ0_9STRA|nr:hypothetical protein NSK_002879 [Nannochloropsis salina CCMP1776]|eukprot:TFJ86059.1 hypothetical protein NSK_002879 [Nannochloropsis salina CCMP1776]